MLGVFDGPVDFVLDEGPAPAELTFGGSIKLSAQLRSDLLAICRRKAETEYRANHATW